MSIEVKPIERAFKLKLNNEVISLPDPNPNFPVKDVQELYTAQYPQLMNATILNHGIENDKQTYEFSTVAGTKG